MNAKDYLNQQPKKLYKVSQLLEAGQIDLDDLADIIPGVLHINSRQDLGMQFLSKKGQDIIRYSLEEVQTLGAEIFQRHQNEKTFTEVYPKLITRLNEGDKDDVVTFFQDWKYKDKEAPVFWFTTTKILNENQTISVSLFPQQIEELTKNVNHLFGVNELFETYFSRYMALTKREKEILVLLGKEYTRKEISMELSVAERTVKKHCENIFKKLGTHSRNEISKIAAAFATFK